MSKADIAKKILDLDIADAHKERLLANLPSVRLADLAQFQGAPTEYDTVGVITMKVVSAPNAIALLMWLEECVQEGHKGGKPRYTTVYVILDELRHRIRASQRRLPPQAAASQPEDFDLDSDG